MLFLDAVFDAVGHKTEVNLVKILQAEIKPNRHETRIVVRWICILRLVKQLEFTIGVDILVLSLVMLSHYAGVINTWTEVYYHTSGYFS